VQKVAYVNYVMLSKNNSRLTCVNDVITAHLCGWGQGESAGSYRGHRVAER